MNRYLLFIPTLFIASICLTSCEESSDSPLFGNLSPAGITGVNTKNEEEFCCWESGSQINLNATNTNYNYWFIHIGESSGYFYQLNSDPLHWRGKVEYLDKQKYKDKKKDIIYIDSLILDITTSESGWNEGTFQIGTTSYEKGENPGPMMMSTYYVRPDAGNFNTLDVSDANHTYIFSFKTRTTDDINSWKLEKMPQGWMNSNGRISMLILPILYSLFQ